MKSLLALTMTAIILSACSNDNPSGDYVSSKSAGSPEADGEGNNSPGSGSGTETGADSANLSWESIRPLTKKFCEDCHLDDGFGKLEIWSTVKDAALVRLKMEAVKGAMPPPETTLGKTITAEEKSRLIAWLETLNQTEREEIGDVRDPAANTKISGDLKLVADAYCVSCHSDGQYLKFWAVSKAEAIKRINNRTMPPGRVLPEPEKQKLLNALNAL